ncbi:Porphobilinogen deaminase, dipyromethane cofactor binding domain containing protein [Elaphomyces granulatus]
MASAQDDRDFSSSKKSTFNIGTRKSKLALLQTDIVLDALKKAWPEHQFTVQSKDTVGDRNTTIALREFTSKNLWTQELEDLLISGDLDLIAHSLKDVPTLLPSNCTLGAVMEREDPRDVLVMKQGLSPSTLSELPPGSVVGTSSIRRSAQLALKYPHLKVMDVRGNIGTRLSKLDAEDGPFTCLILAAAGLLRLDLQGRISQYLDSKHGGMLHAVGQGAIGVEIRKNDSVVAEMLNKIGHMQTTLACMAERSLLRTLEGGCSAPLGVETEWIHEPNGRSRLRMRSIVVSVDGSESAEVEVDGDVDSLTAAEAFGVEVAKQLVTEGAGAILEVIRRKKPS